MTERRHERLGIVSYVNVDPLHHGLVPWNEETRSLTLVKGVPSVLNRDLLRGELDLTLISSVEFLRHADALVALPDFGVATRGPVDSVTLFHRRKWADLADARIAVSSDSATSVALLRTLLDEDGIAAEFVSTAPNLEAMLGEGFDAALLIGDVALQETIWRRPVDGRYPFVTDLGQEWYRRTRLPFTFAVWAARSDRPPSERLVAALRAARTRGLGDLDAVAEAAAQRLTMHVTPVKNYLARFRYFHDDEDREGLATFARRLGLDPTPSYLDG
jgi:chorismate dehydratase